MKKDFRKDLFKLSSGPIIGQMVSLISAPLIAKFYGAESFGISLVFASFSAILIPFANARYDIAIVMAPKKIDAVLLVMLSTIISIFLSLIIFLATLFFGEKLFIIFGIASITNLKWFISISVLIGGIMNVLNAWCTRQKYFFMISKNQVIVQLFVTSSLLIFGFSGFNSPVILIITAILGQLVMLVVTFLNIYLKENRFFFNSMNLIRIKSVALQYVNFPKYSSVATIFNTLSWQTPIMLLSYFFSSQVVGYYGLGFRLIQAPMSLVGNALNQVFYQFGSVNNVKGTLNESVEDLFKWIFRITLLPCFVLLLSSADLFNVFFGDNWREAGVYVQFLTPWAFIWFVSSPLSPVYSITQRQRDEVKVHLLIFLLRILGLLVGGLFSSPRIAILMFSIGGVISYLYLLKQIFLFSEVYVKNFLNFIIKAVARDILICIPLIIVIALNMNMHIITVLSILILLTHLLLLINFKKIQNV
jgi:lipopolysaccharide exporter